MLKIQRVSRGMVAALSVVLVALVLAMAGFAAYPQALIEQMRTGFSLPPDLPPLTAWQYAALAGLAALNLAITLYIIWQLRQMFRLFAAGAVFSSAATRHLFGAAKGMVVGGVIAIFSTTLAVLVLTANAAEGQHVLAVNISSIQLAGMGAGVVFAVMSWVMQEAARLSEENAGFV